MADNKIFRETALETVSNPEQLDQHIRVTRPFSWVILAAILSLVIGVGIWAFTGNISSGTDIVGVMFSSEGVVVANAAVTGKVGDVLVSEGDLVEKGDVMLVIPDEEILAQIKSVKAEYDAAGAGSIRSTLATMLDSLKYQYKINSFITANKSGSVNSVPMIGDVVQAGEQVAVNYSSAAMAGSREIIAYVPYSIATNLSVGAEAQISPSNAQREEYGYMLGKVMSIGSNLVTEESIRKTMGTTKYISALQPTADSVEVRIKPNVDSSTKSGFEWSNDKGAKNIDAEVGTICGVKIMSEEIHPINLIIG